MPLANQYAKRRRDGGLFISLIIVLLLAAAGGWLGYSYYIDLDESVAPGELITAPVTRAAFDHIVLEQGEIESSSNMEVTCQVEARGKTGTTILWVIDEGTRVKEGEKLVELDSSELELQLKDARIQVITAESDVATAKALLEQAQIARQEYLDGVFKTEERAILSEMAVAEQDLRKNQLALQSSERLVAKGLVKSLQLDADKFAVANARNQLEAAEGRLTVLRELTMKKMLVQFDSDIEAAKAKLAAVESALAEKQQELDETQQLIEMCMIYAPADGVVVHANRFSSRGGNAEFVVEAGASVRERQAIIRLPDPTQMQVKCKVNESRITLIEPGMPVKIAIDAIPGMTLKGAVVKVNRYAEPGGFFSSSIKEYATLVEIISPPETIRTGMTAEVQIFVEQLKDAIQIPIQGLYEHGGQMYSLVQNDLKSFETRAVTIRATNDTMASISEGLEEGETVVLNLRSHLNLMVLPELALTDNSDMRELGEQRAADRDAAQSKRPDGVIPKEGNTSGRGRGGRGPGGKGPGAEGRPGSGFSGGGGGGRPDPATIAGYSMQRVDSDGDGTISEEEIKAVDDPDRRSSLEKADSNGDGSVSKAELTESIRQRMSSGGGRP